MVRAISFFVFLAIFVGFGLWFSGQPGSFLITWGDYELQANLGIFFLFFFILVIISSSIWLFLRWLWRMPASIRRSMELKNYNKSSKLLLQFFKAYTGEAFSDALKKLKHLRKRSKNPGFSFWLESKVALKQEELDLSIKYASLASKESSTAFLGCYQLIKIAFKQRSYDIAASYLNQILSLHPKSSWAKKQLGKLYLKNANWKDANDILCSIDTKIKKEKEEKNFFLATASYMQTFEKKATLEDRQELLKKATDYSLAFIPGVEAYANIIKTEKKNTCHRLLENSWKRRPSLNVGSIYVDMAPSEKPIERFKAAQHLMKLAPSSAESFLIVIQKAIDAKLWGEGKAYMEKALEKNIFNKNSFYIKTLKKYLENIATGDISYASLAKNLRISKNSWQCNSCDYFQETWFAECPSCQALFDNKMKNIF